MTDSPLPLILVLLAASVFVVTLARSPGTAVHPRLRHRRPDPGPHAIGAVPGIRHHAPAGRARRGLPAVHAGPGILLAAHGGAAPRGVRPGSACRCSAPRPWWRSIAHLFGLDWPQSIVLGGVVAMSSTVLIVQQLTERAELNRTHGRLRLQRGAVPGHRGGAVPRAGGRAGARWRGVHDRRHALKPASAPAPSAVLVVLAAGRWLLRPLLYVIANSRLRELFTLAVLLVALASAWASQTGRPLDGARRVSSRE